MGPRLIVGCPLRDRVWAMPAWFRHVTIATKRAGFDTFMPVFVIGKDDPTTEVDTNEANKHGLTPHFVHVDESFKSYTRDWSHQRYGEMVSLRNTLLREVRDWGPEYFWSLDSDILAAETALELALDALANRDWAAVGQRCFMTPDGTTCPSYSMIAGGGGLLRPDADGCFPVDVIMASKVMTPAAYAVDYELHEQGEDIGWSLAVHRKGLRLGWDGRSVSKHVMDEQRLDVIDPRCGF